MKKIREVYANSSGANEDRDHESQICIALLEKSGLLSLKEDTHTSYTSKI